MKTKVIFTEKQFDKIIKNLLEQSTPGVQQFQKGQYQSYKTDDYKATGTNLFKQGQDQIDERNPEIIN